MDRIDQDPTEQTHTVLTPDEKDRFRRACATVDRSQAAQLRVLVREFNARTLDHDAPAEVAA